MFKCGWNLSQSSYLTPLRRWFHFFRLGWVRRWTTLTRRLRRKGWLRWHPGIPGKDVKMTIVCATLQVCWNPEVSWMYISQKFVLSIFFAGVYMFTTFACICSTQDSEVGSSGPSCPPVKSWIMGSKNIVFLVSSSARCATHCTVRRW